MNELKFKPVIVLDEVIFEKLKDSKDLLVGLINAANVKYDDESHDIIIETQLTMLRAILSREELESIIYDSKLFLRAIDKGLKTTPSLKLMNSEFILKLRKIEQVYISIIGINNEKINKNVLTEVKKNNLLDLKTRYSVLTKEDMLDCGSFIIVKVEDNLTYLLKNNVIDEGVFKLLYGMYLNTNGIASNISFNNKIDNNLMGSILPYIKNYA